MYSLTDYASAYSLRCMITQLGDRMRAARQKIGISQGALAAAMGVSVITISRLERGVSLPSASVATALARELGVSTDWLLTGEGRGPHNAKIRPEGDFLEVER